MLDIGNSEPFEENLAEGAIRNVKSGVGPRFLMAGGSVRKYGLSCISISVGLIAKRSLLDRVHFEL